MLRASRISSSEGMADSVGRPVILRHGRMFPRCRLWLRFSVPVLATGYRQGECYVVLLVHVRICQCRVPPTGSAEGLTWFNVKTVVTRSVG